ncbi:MAG: hypothetical protein IAF02_06330 [Anaerolineae bacterium]|nr:hypothetical protein [Anaerolineae bacterium]
MDFVRKNPGISLLIVFVLGLVIGLVVLGWGLFPVQWEDATPDALSQQYQDAYVRAVSDAYSFDNNTQKVQEALGGWPGVEATCSLASRTTDPAEAQRLSASAAVINGTGCANVGAVPAAEAVTQAAEPEEGSSLLPILFLGVLLIVLIAAIIFVLNRRKALMDSGSSQVMPDVAAVSDSDDGTETTPIASVDTTYVRGDDRFEYSFPIENETQDFLGDCGIAIAESLGSDTPKNVTAFEVWLFDKNDIRTRTKILMSEHAYHDEGLKAKLATKGTEQILAREGETLVLETVSLILNAIVTEIEYGEEAGQPPESYFDRLSIKFHVWRKEGDYAPDIEGRVEELQQDSDADMDDLLDF